MIGQRANNIKWGSIITFLIINVKLEIFRINVNRILFCLSCSQTEWEMGGSGAGFFGSADRGG